MPDLRIEFHCHTLYSTDSLTRLADLIADCRRKGIDRLIVTDHDTVSGARAAHDLDPELVIMGEEIMTTRGELLAAFITMEVPPGLSPQETISRLREQGAFISVSHPFDVYRSGHWDPEDLLEIVPLVDAIEIFNSRCMVMGFNNQAAQFAQEHDLPGIAGSDAHTSFELGAATVLLPQFESPDGLRRVIRQGKIQARLSPAWVHLASRYASVRKKIRL